MTREGFSSDLKHNILAGLAALFPLLLTVFLLHWFYVQLDKIIGTRINTLCARVIARYPTVFEALFPGAPQDLTNRAEWARQHFPGFVGVAVGLAAALVLVYLLGRLLRGYVGARIVGGVDSFFERFPVIKAIYPHARRVAELLFGQSEQRFLNRVVAVQYPRRGAYTIAFLTGTGLKSVEEEAGQNLITVFVPTSPTPLTGFIVLVPPDDVVEVDMDIDEAFRFCITAGVLAPHDQRPGAATERPLRKGYPARLAFGSSASAPEEQGGKEKAQK